MLRLEAWDATLVQRYKAKLPVWQLPFYATIPTFIITGAYQSLKATLRRDPRCAFALDWSG